MRAILCPILTSSRASRTSQILSQVDRKIGEARDIMIALTKGQNRSLSRLNIYNLAFELRVDVL